LYSPPREKGADPVDEQQSFLSFYPIFHKWSATMKQSMKKLIFVLLAGILITAATPGLCAAIINGAGATFPYPLYSKWFSEYQKIDKEAQINYQSVGSGAGIKQLLEKTVDFGASDAPMNEEQLKKAATPVLHIPTVLGAVVITYNLPGVGKGIKLPSETVAEIFLGKIRRWDDENITRHNPGMKLPKTPIMVAHRSDGSGTTAIFTDFLSKVSPAWKDKVGAGTAVSWPAGLGGKGNEGVTGLIKQTPGSIGYVELIYAENNKLPYASIRNKSGQFVAPTPAAVTSAAQGSLKAMPDDFRISITNAEGADSYPISGFTYLLVHQTMPKAKGEKLVRFLKWAITDGQRFAGPLSYAELPKELVPRVEKKISSIKVQ
jgi:phosphate transport system substrate-binding protein